MKKVIQRVVVSLLIPLLYVTPVVAQSIDYNANDINYYDASGNNVCGPGSGNLSYVNGGDNEKTIFFTLLANGFTKQQAAAVLGNLQQESSFNPKEIEPNGVGHGIVQWSEPGRWDELTKFVGSQDPYSLTAQLSFMLHELNGSYANAYKDFKAKTTLADQVSVWANEYEQAGIIGPRLGYAQAVQTTGWYQSAPDNTTGGNGTSSGGGGSCSTSGGSGQYVNGFVVYNQCDPAWGSHPYSTTTICPSGCGPTAMAMIITNLSGVRVTPDVTADYAASQGMYISGAGSSWSIGPVLAKRWNLKSTPLGSDMTKINAALRAGSLIIMAGQGPVPFTSSGHFIVIRAVTADGKWMVGDSAHTAANSQQFDAQTILSNANGGSIYAISK